MARRSGCAVGGCLKTSLLLLLTPVVLGLGWWWLSNIGRVLTHDSVEAVVVDLIPTRDSDGDILYRPVYEYDVDGRTYRYESMVNLGGVVVPDLGDRKTLLYNPDSPGDARVRNYFLLLALPGILLAIPLIVLGLLAISAIRRSRRPQVVGPGSRSGGVPPWAPPADGEEARVPPWLPREESTPLEVATPQKEVIEATFMGTEPSQMDAAGRVRYRVKARAEIDSVVHRFVGEWLDEDPTLLFMEHGNKVQVRVNSNDPTSYEVLMPSAD